MKQTVAKMNSQTNILKKIVEGNVWQRFNPKSFTFYPNCGNLKQFLDLSKH